MAVSARVGGAVIGALIMGVMNNGMSILGIGIDYQQVIKGLVLLGAVCLDVYNQSARRSPSASRRTLPAVRTGPSAVAVKPFCRASEASCPL